MDSRVSENKVSQPLRRSTRQTSSNVKVLGFELTARGPLKRTRRELKKPTPVTAVNGSGDVETGSEDEESPSKKTRLETGGAVGDHGDEMDVDVQESDEDMEKNEDLEMDSMQESSHGTHQPEICQDALGDTNLSPRVMFVAVNDDPDLRKTERVKPTQPSRPVAPTKSAAQIRPPANRHDVKIRSTDDYQKTMKAKSTALGLPLDNHHYTSVSRASENSDTTRRQRVNNNRIQKPVWHTKPEIKKRPVLERSSGYSCGGLAWCLWRLFLVALICSAVLLACKIIPVLKKTAADGTHPPSAAKPEMFADQLSLLEAQFPSQRPELWRRSKIHLEKHLQTAQPTEPVSLIFTAGHGAERTLHCLAQSLASSFSSALNASVLHIDGASKAGQDSDQVKLDIDNQLRAAFDGDKPVAVIHRFEELPPGSTLIFYRFCDHENAAYKRVFLLFTVLLPQDEVRGDQNLKEVEEMVQDYVKERLVDSSNKINFNEMDLDKFSGLWSRISHLVLPVVSERNVEQKGCR
ncbi:LOW QUALITY PROTEIN: torsin-1A-interacting protein 2-like [Cottoperca gobio]|uniref:LOW QUALITY PROTEIN: torsin-1A-interacting protein 2-like n=1 Tax=Cottoperca gobio TaxID=56716 RepID=A0A6J2PK30_COTGO|nr:LOW QUALITY PROTEIN: torsin-1A-interacting protein 2-like [Cottoperca gobio]